MIVEDYLCAILNLLNVEENTPIEFDLILFSLTLNDTTDGELVEVALDPFERGSQSKR